MLALVVLAATASSLLCIGSSAYLAYKDKSQWVWFAAMSFIVGWGGITMLNTIGVWRIAARG